MPRAQNARTANSGSPETNTDVPPPIRGPTSADQRTYAWPEPRNHTLSPDGPQTERAQPNIHPLTNNARRDEPNDPPHHSANTNKRHLSPPPYNRGRSFNLAREHARAASLEHPVTTDAHILNAHPSPGAPETNGPNQYIPPPQPSEDQPDGRRPPNRLPTVRIPATPMPLLRNDARTTDNRPEKKRMRANINIATLNINGSSAPSRSLSLLEKWAMINQTLNEHKIAILAIQESHLDQEKINCIRESFGKKMQIEFSMDESAPRSHAGVAFVINKSLISPRAIHVHELVPGNALALKIDWLETESTTLLNIYAPVNRRDQAAFWTTVDSARRLKRFPRPDFMLGDLNVTEDPIDRAPARADDRSATDALRDIRLAWDLRDVWRTMHPDMKEYTYWANSNNQQSMSRLDRIYAKDQIHTFILNCEITASPVPTDHWLVVAKYAPRDAPEIGKGRWSIPLHLINNKKFIERVIEKGRQLENDIENLESEEVDRNTDNPQRLWEIFKDCIIEIAKDVLGTSHHKINTKIKLLEKDRRELLNSPDNNDDNEKRVNSAIIANEIEYLTRTNAQNKKDNLAAKLSHHGEKLGGIWSAINKQKKPRDTIRRLKIPNSSPAKYERDSARMAELAKEYHDALQKKDIPPDAEDHEERTSLILDEVPRHQTLCDLDALAMDRTLTESQIEKALHLSKNGSATGLDGCPYELWKKLKEEFDNTDARNPRFNIIKVMTTVLTDIQLYGVDNKTAFALGWICPLYKKKDKTEISNYRPITLLNSDYKLLTKGLAVQLMHHVGKMIHSDQAGFIPNRSIIDHIKLATAIINYAEATEEDGAIIALDQEKAYDKIRHNYLWATLDAFNLPPTFTKTIKSLYENASTCVAINGFFSDPFKVTRGIRQGDPLSCALFDLAIEPLACMIRKDPNLKGISIPGLNEPLKAKFFADDTSLFLSKSDHFDYIQMLLEDWCRVSGAKFNLDKTEVIPIGSTNHRQQVIRTRKINQLDQERLNDRIKIANDGDAIRFLGGWIGNHTNAGAPWEPIVDRANKLLEQWGASRPTMKGRKIIIQTIIGGLTQYLTMAQGMPDNVESAFIKMIRKFIWNDDLHPRLGLDILQRPVNEGGLNLLNLKARNEAIEIMWLKAYLNFSPSRPAWAIVTDHLIDAAAPMSTNPEARENTFLQNWNPITKGARAAIMGKDTSRMIKTARKYNTNLEALRLTPQIRSMLPTWYHLASRPAPIVGAAARCLLARHKSAKVADLVKISARIRLPNTEPTPHVPRIYCYCQDCITDRDGGCCNPHACALEAQKRLELIDTRLNPLTPGNNHLNLTLTRRRKKHNELAKANNGEILFDPTMTCKEDLAECFRIFTDPSKISDKPAERIRIRETTLTLSEIKVYTDGACLNNGMANAQSGAGVWFGPNHEKNQAIKIPGMRQSNQVGEVVAIIAALTAVPLNQPLKIVTDSKYAINGLTTHLGRWEDQGWINIENAPLFKKAAFLLRKRTARTSFQWVKGHAGDQGNEGSDELAKMGATKEDPDEIDLNIPIEFDLQGAKLAAITQKRAYRGICEKIKKRTREASERNMQCTRAALQEYNEDDKPDGSVWTEMRNPAIRTKVQQFLYKSMHSVQKIGSYWNNIPEYEHRSLCKTCQVPESMKHILIECSERCLETIWNKASALWPHNNIPWPTISLGVILGCGSLAPKRSPAPANNENCSSKQNTGAKRLMNILISESAYLIWVLRCERAIDDKTHTIAEVEKRWLRAINKRLIEDKIIATRIKRDSKHKNKTKSTWEPVLRKAGELPDRWIHQREVLVGTSRTA